MHLELLDWIKKVKHTANLNKYLIHSKIHLY